MLLLAFYSNRAGVCNVFLLEVCIIAVSVYLSGLRASITLNPAAKREEITKQGEPAQRQKIRRRELN